MLAASQMDPQIWVFAYFFENFKPNCMVAGMHGANNIISHVTVHPCAKYEVIWTMVGELMVLK